MRVALPLLVIASSIAVAAAQAPSPSPMPSGPPAAPAAAGPSGSPPPWVAENERYLAAVNKAIVGKEDKPAKEVFKNLKLLGDLPAARIPRTMQAFTRSLGVACTHCHVADDWDSDSKDDKEVTRDMMKMTSAINDDYIKPIKAIAEDKPSVTCAMCHRGQAKAGSEMRRPGPAGPPRN